MGDLLVTVPANADFIHLLRTVVAAAAARRDFSIDSIDDLRLAVDEGASYLLRAKASASKITLQVTNEGKAIRAIVWSDAEVSDWPPPAYEDSLAWKVLSGLTDEAAFVDQEGHPAVLLTKSNGGTLPE